MCVAFKSFPRQNPNGVQKSTERTILCGAVTCWVSRGARSSSDKTKWSHGEEEEEEEKKTENQQKCRRAFQLSSEDDLTLWTSEGRFSAEVETTRLQLFMYLHVNTLLTSAAGCYSNTCWKNNHKLKQHLHKHRTVRSDSSPPASASSLKCAVPSSVGTFDPFKPCKQD